LISEEEDGPTNSIVDQLVLNVKALMLLGESRESIARVVNDKITSSHDEQIQEFVSILQREKAPKGSSKGYLLTATGELILASFLIIAGLTTILPSVVGLSSPEELVSFIGQITSSVSVQTLRSPIIPAMELLLAIGLLLGAFHTVRIAASHLGEITFTPYIETQKETKNRD
jgi:hypothetical protein